MFDLNLNPKSFCSCDLDFDLVILICASDYKILKMYRYTQNERTFYVKAFKR